MTTGINVRQLTGDPEPVRKRSLGGPCDGRHDETAKPGADHQEQRSPAKTYAAPKLGRRHDRPSMPPSPRETDTPTRRVPQRHAVPGTAGILTGDARVSHCLCGHQLTTNDVVGPRS